MRRTLRMLGACAAAALAGAPLLAVTGFVFEDRNGNGIRDPGEPGIPLVEVSNGADVAVTDSTGAYALPDRPGARAFVVKPRNWSCPRRPEGGARFDAAPGAASADFALSPSVEPEEMRVLVTTDPQPVSATEVGYLSDGLVRRLGRPEGVSFGVTLGDIVYDHPELFGPVSAAFARTGLAWHYLPGNHDLTLGAGGEAPAVAAYEAFFGPSTYAFHAGPALFIALDDVRPLGGPRYIGGLTGEQFSLVERLLGRSPASEWVVVMLHIPLFQPYPSGPETFRDADRTRLFALLKDRPRVLILSGHTHYQRHVLHGREDGWEGKAPLHEYNVAAACGGYWGGPPGDGGVPPSPMWDGTPPGYAVLSLTQAGPGFDYFPALLPADRQMGLHVPRAVAPHQGYVPFFANVFNGHAGWQVQARIDGGGWVPMSQTLAWDPAYAEAYLRQDAAAVPGPGVRLPEPVVCYHLWKGILPADLARGTHVLEVRATEPDGRSFDDSRSFDVVEPHP